MSIDFSGVRALLDAVEAGEAAQLRLLDMLTTPVQKSKVTLSATQQCDPGTNRRSHHNPNFQIRKCEQLILDYCAKRYPKSVTTRQMDTASLPMARSTISSSCSELVAAGLLERLDRGVFRSLPPAAEKAKK